MLTQPRVRYLLTERIKLLPVESSYGTPGTDSWREASEPLLPEYSPDVWTHLDFFVDDRQQDYLDRAGWNDEGVTGQIVVRFLVEVLPGDKKSSWDKAAYAGEALRRWLATSGSWSEDLVVGPSVAGSGVRMRRTPIAKQQMDELEPTTVYRLSHILVEIPISVQYDTPR